MNKVISIRVTEEMHKEMQKLRRSVDWNQEIRDFIQKRVDDKKKDDVLASVTERIRKNPAFPSGSAAQLEK